MKTHARTIALGVAIIASVVLASGNEAMATGSFTCNNRTIKGSFGTHLSGFVSPDGVSQVPFAEVGIFKLDGRGSLTGSDTASIGGNVSARQFTGTYAVALNCTLTASVTNQGDGSVSNFAGVIVDGGEASLLVSSDPFTTVSGRAERVGSILLDRD